MKLKTLILGLLISGNSVFAKDAIGSNDRFAAVPSLNVTLGSGPALFREDAWYAAAKVNLVTYGTPKEGVSLLSPGLALTNCGVRPVLSPIGFYVDHLIFNVDYLPASDNQHQAMGFSIGYSFK